VMADAHEGSRLFREVGSTVARSALRRSP
jgi:hypothetical protein